MSTYRWVRWENAGLEDVGILADGTLHNPHGYDADVVRRAVLAADERRRERRSIAAQKAATTRQRRRDKKVYEVARQIVEGHVCGPCATCSICGRGLDDPESITRGIGSECWSDVLGCIETAC